MIPNKPDSVSETTAFQEQDLCEEIGLVRPKHFELLCTKELPTFPLGIQKCYFTFSRSGICNWKCVLFQSSGKEKIRLK